MTTPRDLELYVRGARDREPRLFVRSVALAEIARLLRKPLDGSVVAMFRAPDSVLNPAYWERRSDSEEREARRRLGGIWESVEGGARRLWRADRVPANRAFRDGLDVPCTILPGPVLQVTGEGFLALAAASGRADESVRLVAADRAPSGAETLAQFEDDLRTMRLGHNDERILLSAESGRTRIVLARTDDHLRALGELLRGVLEDLSGEHVAPIRKATVAAIADMADGLGVRSEPERDFTDKDRSLELTLHLGGTGWAQEELPSDADRILLYYDRTSGIWEAILQ